MILSAPPFNPRIHPIQQIRSAPAPAGALFFTQLRFPEGEGEHQIPVALRPFVDLPRHDVLPVEQPPQNNALLAPADSGLRRLIAEIKLRKSHIVLMTSLSFAYGFADSLFVVLYFWS